MACCTVGTALLCEILYKMYKFDMKRQHTASPDRRSAVREAETVLDLYSVSSYNKR